MKNNFSRSEKLFFFCTALVRKMSCCNSSLCEKSCKTCFQALKKNRNSCGRKWSTRIGRARRRTRTTPRTNRNGPTRSILIVSHGPGRSGTLSSPARSLRCNPSSGARQKTLVTPPLGNSKAMARSMLEAQDFGKTIPLDTGYAAGNRTRAVRKSKLQTIG